MFELVISVPRLILRLSGLVTSAPRRFNVEIAISRVLRSSSKDCSLLPRTKMFNVRFAAQLSRYNFVNRNAIVPLHPDEPQVRAGLIEKNNFKMTVRTNRFIKKNNTATLAQPSVQGFQPLTKPLPPCHFDYIC